MDELEAKIRALLGRPQTAALATLDDDGTPWVRYVTVYADDDLTLRCCTGASTRKARQIRAHPAVHLLCGQLQPPDGSLFLQIAGQAEIVTAGEEKRAFWREEWRRYFSGADDPEYVIVAVHPHTIEYNGPDSPQPAVWRRA